MHFGGHGETFVSAGFMCCHEINSKSSPPSPDSKVLVSILVVKHFKHFQISKMSGCRYPYTEDDCSAHHPASIFYYVSTIAAMVVLGSITLLFFCCIYYRGRRIAQRLRNARSRGHQATSAVSPVTFVWPGAPSQVTHPAAQGEADDGISKGVSAGSCEPLSCVIMAGEERPTHLARPLPTRIAQEPVNDE